MDEGTLIMSGVEEKGILDAIKVVTDQNVKMNQVADYKAPYLASKVVRIILSYTDYVNRTVWKRY